jgi:hypothetical protein
MQNMSQSYTRNQNQIQPQSLNSTHAQLVIHPNPANERFCQRICEISAGLAPPAHRLDNETGKYLKRLAVSL